jgi:hypothetical protein
MVSSRGLLARILLSSILAKFMNSAITIMKGGHLAYRKIPETGGTIFHSTDSIPPIFGLW